MWNLLLKKNGFQLSFHWFGYRWVKLLLRDWSNNLSDIWSISQLSKSFMVVIRSPDILARLVQTICLGCLTSYFNSASLTNFILKLLLIEVSLVRMPPKTTMESSVTASWKRSCQHTNYWKLTCNRRKRSWDGGLLKMSGRGWQKMECPILFSARHCLFCSSAAVCFSAFLSRDDYKVNEKSKRTLHYACGDCHAPNYVHLCTLYWSCCHLCTCIFTCS